jgi:RNA polymerase subunit RPABC4/transcription elongation factor Spt4
MEYVVIALVLAVILILLGLGFFLPKRNKDDEQKNSIKDEEKTSKFCPLCSSSLLKGENVKSKTYPTESKDMLMDVFGCPKCIPPVGTEDRICPVCKKKLPKDGFVIGRYFIKPHKKHLHVLGCTLCRKAK